jgi:hypothetical protein
MGKKGRKTCGKGANINIIEEERNNRGKND